MKTFCFLENIGVVGEAEAAPSALTRDYLKSGDVLRFGESNIGIFTTNGG